MGFQGLLLTLRVEDVTATFGSWDSHSPRGLAIDSSLMSLHRKATRCSALYSLPAGLADAGTS